MVYWFQASPEWPDRSEARLGRHSAGRTRSTAVTELETSTPMISGLTWNGGSQTCGQNVWVESPERLPRDIAACYCPRGPGTSVVILSISWATRKATRVFWIITGEWQECFVHRGCNHLAAAAAVTPHPAHAAASPYLCQSKLGLVASGLEKLLSQHGKNLKEFEHFFWSHNCQMLPK